MSEPIDRVLQALTEKGCQPRRGRGDKWEARCPNSDAHKNGDKRPSFGVTVGSDGRAVVHCMGTCTPEEICASLGLGMSDLFRPRERTGPEQPEATYDYTDEGGKLLFQVMRFPGKQFRQRHPAEDGSWAWGIKGVRRVIYRLPKVLEAVANGVPVYIVEGEKDVHAVESKGAVATCNPGGTGMGWLDDYSPHFDGAEARIVLDKDEPGVEHGQRVAASVRPFAKSVRIFEPRQGKDVSDHLAFGNKLEHLLDLTPAYEPPARVVRLGGDFILDTPPIPESLWGADAEVLWAKGESLILDGPSGAGKTTVIQQVVIAMLGIRKPELLGMPVQPCAGRVLYIAADRPRQAARSFRRMVSEADRATLNRSLIFWPGPLPFNLSTEPTRFLPWIREQGDDVSVVIVDSLKDIALDLSKDESGSRVNNAFQLVLADEIDLGILHHQRKADRGTTTKPKHLDDVYGSTWITAGAGSVVLVWGEPGDLVVDFDHLKQPSEQLGPWKLLHDHLTGTTRRHEAYDLIEMAREARGGLLVRDAAIRMFGVNEPSENQMAKARRKLKSEVQKGRLSCPPVTKTGDPDRYFLAPARSELPRNGRVTQEPTGGYAREMECKGVPTDVQVTGGYAPETTPTHLASVASPPFRGEAGAGPGEAISYNPLTPELWEGVDVNRSAPPENEEEDEVPYWNR